MIFVKLPITALIDFTGASNVFTCLSVLFKSTSDPIRVPITITPPISILLNPLINAEPISLAVDITRPIPLRRPITSPWIMFSPILIAAVDGECIPRTFLIALSNALAISIAILTIFFSPLARPPRKPDVKSSGILLVRLLIFENTFIIVSLSHTNAFFTLSKFIRSRRCKFLTNSESFDMPEPTSSIVTFANLLRPFLHVSNPF